MSGLANNIFQTPQTKIHEEIKGRTCSIITLSGKATGFFVSREGTLVTVFHILSRGEDGWVTDKDIIAEYRGKQYSAFFSERFRSLLEQERCLECHGSSRLENLDVCLLELSPKSQFPYFDSVHNNFRQLLSGLEVYFAGYPFQEKEVNVHKGSISAKSISDCDIQEFNIDGTVVKGCSGGPIVYSDGDPNHIHLIGMMQKTAANAYEEFLKHCQLLEGLNKKDLSVISWKIQNLSEGKQEKITLIDLFQSQLSFLEKNISTGIGKAIHSSHILEVMNSEVLLDQHRPVEARGAGMNVSTSLDYHRPEAVESVVCKGKRVNENHMKYISLLRYIMTHSQNTEAKSHATQLYEKANSLLEIDESQMSDSLSKFTKLNLSGRRLDDLDSSLSLLPNLVNLDLTHNNLNQIPEVVFDLKRLKVLVLRGNKIEELPTDKLLNRLPCLNRLDILENPIKEVSTKLEKKIRDLPYLAEWVDE